MTILVLEGPDLGGKSTVGKRLSRLTGLPVGHAEGRPQRASELCLRVLSYTPKQIVDRHSAISELIYTRCLKRPQLLNDIDLLKLVECREIIIFHCTKPLDYLVSKFEHLQHSDKEYKTASHRQKVIDSYECIYEQYNALLSRLEAPVLTVDFEHTTDQQLLEFINEHKRHQD